MKKLLIVMSVFTMLLVSCTQPVQEEIPEPSIVTIEDSNQVSEENKPEEKSEEPVTEEPVQESSNTDDKELVEEPVVEEKSEESSEEKSEEPIVEEPIVEEPVQEPIVEEPVEEPAIEESTIEEPVVEELAEEPIVEEPIEDTWIEVNCFDETYGMDYIIFPEELDVTSGYRFENGTEPNNDYQLFKFEYVKTLVLNNENNAQYVLNGEVKTIDSCYHTVKCYKLYLNTKYTGDELVIVYPDIYVTNNWMKYSLGYHVEKMDDDYSLKLAFYIGYKNKMYTSENDTNENLKSKRNLLLSYYEEDISE